MVARIEANYIDYPKLKDLGEKDEEQIINLLNTCVPYPYYVDNVVPAHLPPVNQLAATLKDVSFVFAKSNVSDLMKHHSTQI
jgi:Icc-related predicted phosphoesterase